MFLDLKGDRTKCPGLQNRTGQNVLTKRYKPDISNSDSNFSNFISDFQFNNRNSQISNKL